MSAINHFGSVAVPIYFAYVALMWLLGDRIESELIRRDCYAEGRIKIRTYSIISTLLTACCVGYSCGYFFLAKIWHLSAFFGVFLFGFLWIQINTYCVRVRFTASKISYRAWSITKEIPFSDISQICWEASRHSIGYVLVIYCTNGNKLMFSSRDFVGLVLLKDTYESIDNMQGQNEKNNTE